MTTSKHSIQLQPGNAAIKTTSNTNVISPDSPFIPGISTERSTRIHFTAVNAQMQYQILIEP